jgi:hypothetical protein
MDQALDARFSGEPRHAGGSFHMDRMERLLAALHIETYGIHNAKNTCYGSGNGAIIVDVGIGRLNAEVNAGKQCCGAFWMPGCDPHRMISLKQALDDVPAKKASSAEYGHLIPCPFRVRSRRSLEPNRANPSAK